MFSPKFGGFDKLWSRTACQAMPCINPTEEGGRGGGVRIEGEGGGEERGTGGVRREGEDKEERVGGYGERVRVKGKDKRGGRRGR